MPRARRALSIVRRRGWLAAGCAPRERSSGSVAALTMPFEARIRRFAWTAATCVSVRVAFVGRFLSFVRLIMRGERGATRLATSTAAGRRPAGRHVSAETTYQAVLCMAGEIVRSEEVFVG
jgi:hypothetical protein